MKIAVISDERLKEELLATGLQEAVQVEWLKEPLPVEGADAYFDLLYTPGVERTRVLTALPRVPVFINAVDTTLRDLPENMIRLNGWNSFLKRNLAELSCSGNTIKPAAEKIIAGIGRTAEWVPDIPGFIAARVVSMIINEAYFALDEKVSTKEEIDIAMKLGTNYPYGPFEWAGIIGLKKVYDLLAKLAETEPRYRPSPLLEKEALSS